MSPELQLPTAHQKEGMSAGEVRRWLREGVQSDHDGRVRSMMRAGRSVELLYMAGSDGAGVLLALQDHQAVVAIPCRDVGAEIAGASHSPGLPEPVARQEIGARLLKPRRAHRGKLLHLEGQHLRLVRDLGVVHVPVGARSGQADEKQEQRQATDNGDGGPRGISCG